MKGPLYTTDDGAVTGTKEEIEAIEAKAKSPSAWLGLPVRAVNNGTIRTTDGYPTTVQMAAYAAIVGLCPQIEKFLELASENWPANMDPNRTTDPTSIALRGLERLYLEAVRQP